MVLYLIARWTHILAGMTAFLALWLPLVARKGGPLHRKVGWVYVVAMAVVAVTGLGLSGWRFLESRDPMALFLMYVGVLSAASSSLGVRVLRTRTRTGAHRHPFDLGLACLLVLSALVTAGYGLAVGEPLLYGFAPVGLLSGSAQLFYWLRPPTGRMHWWFQHMGAMIGSGIGTLTAFLVVNAPHLGVEGFQLAVFLGPTVVGVVGLNLWQRYYRRRFTAKPSALGATSAAATP